MLDRHNRNGSGGGSLEQVAPAGRSPRDKRAEPRHRTYLRPGSIFDLRQNLICRCLVSDRSRRGARIKLSPRVDLPGQVLFSDEGLAPVRAHVRWRRDSELGLWFAAAPSPQPQS